MPPILRDLNDSPYAARVADLIAAAQTVREKAYAPYSGFRVGAAVLTADGAIHSGANIEGADYDVTHAEESAFSAMRAATASYPVLIVAIGAPDRDAGQVISPCGKCRQKIYEWVRRDPAGAFDVIIALPRSGEFKLCSIRELLPLTFG